MAATSSMLADRSTRNEAKMLPQTAKPPKSKTEPYYSIHPSWTDISPIPQMDLEQPSTYTTGPNALSSETAQKLASAGPALATIAYTPRYIEAMSYLRAMMAEEEYTERALILTDDIISMNPAHYTVWIYRFRVLKEIWGLFSGKAGINDKARNGFETELKWLDKVSEKNLKNYQIWHHRQSLFQLLPKSAWVTSLLDAEPEFLKSILALDTKNYHVWSYRQWLCAHFYQHFLLDNSKELKAIDTMITHDVMNNSAWNHRYFINFGYKDNVKEQATLSQDSSAAGLRESSDDIDNEVDADVIDLDIVDRELEYVKNKIRYAPQNGSSWNYLKGILKYAGIPASEMKSFCAEFVGENFTFDELDGDNGKVVRSSQAIEMCVEIFASEPQSEDAKQKVRHALDSLSKKWDPIRTRYWAWRLDRYEREWTNN